MDESSPVYENFMNKMSTMGSSRPKINRTTFNIGANVLEKRVANNSRKITLIKNVISTGKSDLGSQLASLDGRSSSPESDLTEINETLNDIGNALALDFSNRITQRENEIDALREGAEAKKRGGIEAGLEAVNKITNKVGKAFSAFT